MTDLLHVQLGNKDYAVTPDELLGMVTYLSYKAQRQRAPSITPEQWGVVFPQWERLEARYQQELKNG